MPKKRAYFIEAYSSVDGTAHLPTFCPVGTRDGPSGSILSSMQIGQNVGRLGKMLADGTSHLLTSRLQIGQNVGRWDVPSADVPSVDWANRSQMGSSADGTAHLPTFRPVFWEHFVQYADWAKCCQMACGIC